LASHLTMTKLTDQQRRALQFLANSPSGCTEAVMLAHGFGLEMLGQLVLDRLAEAETRTTMAGTTRAKVIWMRITEAGRKAIAE
jgi:hypothetical protein